MVYFISFSNGFELFFFIYIYIYIYIIYIYIYIPVRVNKLVHELSCDNTDCGQVH
jgi:hypothetical protein